MNQYLKDDVASVIMEVEVSVCSRQGQAVGGGRGRWMVVGLIEGYKGG